MSRRTWMFAAPLGAAALLDSSTLPWAFAATAITWNAVAASPPPRLDSEPQLQLMRSRRRGEHAAVVVARADRLSRRAQNAVWAALRATDGCELIVDDAQLEIRAVLEGHGLDRGMFEERMRTVLGDAGVRFGWASFPEDGVTLDVLIDAARMDIARVPSAEPESVLGAAGAMPVASTVMAEGR